MSAALRPLEVAAGIIWQGERFLACQRPQGKPLAGYWELPGGKLEKGETPAQALCRELAEELQITATRINFRSRLEYPYKDRGLLVSLHFFDVFQFSGEVKPQEFQQIQWIKPSAWRKLNFLPADAEILQNLAFQSRIPAGG